MIYIDPSGHFDWKDELQSAWDFTKCLGVSVVNVLNSANYAVAHPMRTINSLSMSLTHPVDTINAIVDSYRVKMQTSRGQGEICGEITQLLFTAGAGTTINGSSKAIKICQFIDDTPKLLEKTYTIYQNVDKATGNVDYVGGTSNLAQRAAQQAKVGRAIKEIPGFTNLTYFEARAAEQKFIELYSLQKNGGTLTNKINSIAKSNPIYSAAQQQGEWMLRFYGYTK